jgi:two-component sensor histidine kinase
MQAYSIDPMRAERSRAEWIYIDEIAHRTMNDYAFMLATVERARRAASDQASLRALSDVSARLRAGAKAHWLLCPPRERGVTRLDDELEGLCLSLSAAMPADRVIPLTLVCEPIELSAFRSWQASLIVSELITNAVKHAFSACETGEVKVAVRRVGDEIQILVADDGNGAGAISPGHGSSIINALTEELDGAIWRSHTANGSVVAVYFPLQPPVTMNRT